MQDILIKIKISLFELMLFLQCFGISEWQVFIIFTWHGLNSLYLSITIDIRSSMIIFIFEEKLVVYFYLVAIYFCLMINFVFFVIFLMLMADLLIVFSMNWPKALIVWKLFQKIWHLSSKRRLIYTTETMKTYGHFKHMH